MSTSQVRDPLGFHVRLADTSKVSLNVPGTIGCDRSIRSCSRTREETPADRIVQAAAPSRSDVASLTDVEKYQKRQQESHISSGIPALDSLLPNSGFQKGTIVEWVCDGIGSGARTLALLSASKILNHSSGPQSSVIPGSANHLPANPSAEHSVGSNLLVIDGSSDFYPVTAQRLGIDLKRTVVVRPVAPDKQTHANNVLWALEQALRSTAIGIIMCDIEHLNGHTFRRLQLAAEAGGGLCFLRRPTTAIRQPGWADVRMQVQSITSDQAWRRFTVELLKSRSGLTGQRVELDYHDETHDVRLAAELADPTAVHRAARA